MPCLSLGFPFSQHTTPRGCVLAFEKHCSMGCRLKLKFRIHRDKSMEQFSLHFCDFFLAELWVRLISWIKWPCLLGLQTQYSGIIQLIWLIETVQMSVSVITGVSGFWASKPHQICGRNVLLKEWNSGGCLVPLQRLHLSSALAFPSCPWRWSIFLQIFISGHTAYVLSVSITSHFLGIRKTRLICY